MNDYINYYDLLGISKTASDEEIKNAYRNQAKKWHPDLNKDPKAPEMARKINEAKEILLDENKRKEYDIYLENYKSGIYDNLDKKQNTNYNQNNYQEKTYTKWEYFILYLKYYKVNVFRKILGSIFVLLESFICFILQSINYILAFIIAYFGYYLTYIFIILGILLISCIAIKPVFNFNIPPNNSFDYILMIFGAIISLIIGFFIEYIPYILIYRIPVLITKLNMFLFKVSIGYKK